MSAKEDIAKLDPNMRSQDKATGKIKWFSPAKTPFQLTGFPWFKTDHVYRRLPLKGANTLRPAVNYLANRTAGGQIRFRSNTGKLALRVTLDGLANMNHMPATGQCGFDLYIGSGASQRFCSVTKYNQTQPSYEVTLMDHPRTGMRDFTLNFPLYRGVKDVQIGVDADARIRPPPPYAAPGRIVVYGTSITQGGCASRPGLAYTNILSRRLNMEFVNLGFSGNGKGDPEVARMMAQIPAPCLLVLDYDGNCDSCEQLGQTLPEFIRILRDQHKDVPILVVSHPPFARDCFLEESRREQRRRRDVQAATVKAERRKGDANIHFMDGRALLGKDADECTVDGTHPTDLGFYRMAERFEPVYRKLLGLRN